MTKTDADYERECLEAEMAMGNEVMAENARRRTLRDARDVEPITLAEANEQIAEREATITLREALEEVAGS